MKSNKSRISAVPTNIITGFLGVGKTSTILHLLKHKPENERWAVLVNEFGEIGVDGSLFEGEHAENQGVYICEVPGGCMCCAAGVSMQIALNQLLSQAKPDRVLIEPTGLGHPKEVLQSLSTEFYQEALSLQKTVCLVDARKLTDERYTSHEIFNQQIEMADLVIGNKMDLYHDDDKLKLTEYVKQKGQPHADVVYAEYGVISPSLLNGNIKNKTLKSHHSHHHDHEIIQFPSDTEFPECGYIKATNEGEGYQSIGWHFASDKVFERKSLFSFLSGLHVDRMKAVFNTNAGAFAYNMSDELLKENPLNDCIESKIEIIAEQLNDTLESELLVCILD